MEEEVEVLLRGGRGMQMRGDVTYPTLHEPWLRFAEGWLVG